MVHIFIDGKTIELEDGTTLDVSKEIEHFNKCLEAGFIPEHTGEPVALTLEEN